MRKKSAIFESIELSLLLLTKKEKKNLIYLSIYSFLTSLLEVFALMSVFPFLATLFDPEILTKNKNYLFIWEIIGSPIYTNFVLIIGILICLILFISTTAGYFLQVKNNKFSAKCQERFGFDLFKLLISADYEWHVSQNSTFLMTLFLSHISIWSKTVIRQIPIIIGNLSLILVPSLSLILISPKIGFFLIFSLGGIILYFLKFIRKKSNRLSAISKVNYEKLSIFVNELLQGIKDVKLTSRELMFLKRFNNIYHQCSMSTSSINNWNQLPTFFITFLSQVAVILIGTLLVFLKLSPDEIISIMAIVVLLSSRIIPAINRLGNSLTGLSNTNSWIKTLSQVEYDLKKYSTRELKIFKSNLNWQSLKFENVSYKYPTSKQNVIDSAKLEINSGKHYGFVGLSGSGKSTIIDLFLGLLSPNKGFIKVDSLPLEKIGIKNWQANIGYVPQNPIINNCSLKENIAFGIDKKFINNERIAKCIKQASLSDLIKSLPNGIDSNLGDKGNFLSGGQKQRVAIARALYNDPKILIFDEATSSQDSKNENYIRESIDNLKGEITILSISHRFYTINNCDHIFVVKNGRIKEEGTYKQLSEKSKYFRELEGSIKNIEFKN